MHIDPHRNNCKVKIIKINEITKKKSGSSSRIVFPPQLIPVSPSGEADNKVKTTRVYVASVCRGILDLPAIVIKFAKSCHNSNTCMDAMLLARSCPSFPLWPIMLAFLLLSCGILGGGHFCLPPSPTLLLTKSIRISCSKNSIKLCKGQKQADFKGAGWGDMLHTKAPDTSFSTQTPCTSKTDPASWNKAQSWTWSLISAVLALLLLCFVRLDGATLCSKPWPLQPTLFAWGSTHSHTCRQSQTAIKQEIRRKLIREKNQCADNTVSSLTDYRHRECCCCLFW